MANTEGQGHKDGGYGLGWAIIPERQDWGACYHQSETVLHSGEKNSLSRSAAMGCTGCERTPPPTGPKGLHFGTQGPTFRVNEMNE